MRTSFIETLGEAAAQDDRIWLLCGDLGFSVLEPFANEFPDRFVNVGVAEQNMTGVAAGLALCGKIVFTYSIANFPIMRCLEQVRNDICYHHLNVKVVAVGGGLSYASAGYTHHAVEDLAVMRVLPGMTVIAPADPIETRLATRAIIDHPGPCYLRLGKAGEPVVHTSEPLFRIGTAIPVRAGSDVSLISTGSALRLAIEAADELAASGISAAVISMPTVQPVDGSAICRAAAETRHIVTVEEHGRGGLASAVLEALAASPTAARFEGVYLDSEPIRNAGSQSALAASLGVSVPHLIEAVRRVLA